MGNRHPKHLKQDPLHSQTVVFGVPLHVSAERSQSIKTVPAVLKNCLDFLNQRGNE